MVGRAALEVARDLGAFVQASPSPDHAVQEAARRLTAAGFGEVRETDAWPAGAGAGSGSSSGAYLRRGGSLVAWVASGGRAPHAGFRVVAAHTDSPNLRVKPQPDLTRAGFAQLAVEVYGGPLLNSWLDRDLGLSGRVAVRSEAGSRARLVRVDRPVLRIPQLAIHLDRDASSGLTLNPQQHLTPVWGMATSSAGFRSFLADELGVEAGDVLAWDLMVHDLTPVAVLGVDGSMLAAPRLDNLATCHAALAALVRAAEGDAGGAASGPAYQPVVVLFDHEEVGSESQRGAQSTLLPAVLERLVAARGGGREDLWRALADTVVVSADMAHATHPNYPERHDPQHLVALDGGPVLKSNAKLRYATDSMGAACFLAACEQADAPVQWFVSRNDMPCGSTVGPMTAALTGATTVDIGSPMLSMHSARELTGTAGQAWYADALTAFLAPA